MNEPITWRERVDEPDRVWAELLAAGRAAGLPVEYRVAGGAWIEPMGWRTVEDFLWVLQNPALDGDQFRLPYAKGQEAPGGRWVLVAKDAGCEVVAVWDDGSTSKCFCDETDFDDPTPMHRIVSVPSPEAPEQGDERRCQECGEVADELRPCPCDRCGQTEVCVPCAIDGATSLIRDLRAEVERLTAAAPPTGAQVVECVKAGGWVETWAADVQEWEAVGACGRGGIPDDDTPQPGLRLVPAPSEPPTELVPWYEAKGRKVPSGGVITAVANLRSGPRCVGGGFRVPVDADGRVRVLSEDEGSEAP